MCYLANEVTMEEIFMVFAVLFGLLIVSFVFFAVAKNKRDADNNSKPIQSGKARLVDKQQLSSDTILSISEMWVLFELENGNRVQLIAKAQNNLVIGDEGYLTWQGNKILKFERKK